MTHAPAPTARETVLSPAYAATTIASFALIVFVAFEALAVATVMPTVARELDGLAFYALAFATPLASGVVGMVVAGMWSDRSGPGAPLLASLALFAVGLLVCGTAPSMELLLLGRLVQGLGGGALSVGLYVLVGLIYPARLQPAVFAAFSAAWVLPALFGPGLAAYVSHQWGWRWVFLGVVIFVLLALLLLTPALRRLQPPSEPVHAPLSRLGWALGGAVGVLLLDVLGSGRGAIALAAVGALALTMISMHRLLPTGTLVGRRGLPAVVATRGLMSAVFFAAEAYIVYVLQEHWGLTPGRAGLALTGVGIIWALASQLQSRLGERVSHARAMFLGALLVWLGLAAVALTIALFDAGLEPSAALPIAAYVFAGAGMGFGYPRTSVAMLGVSTDADRGFNSAALMIADAMGAALALSFAGVSYAVAQRGTIDPFLVVFLLISAGGLLGVLTAARSQTTPVGESPS